MIPPSAKACSSWARSGKRPSHNALAETVIGLYKTEVIHRCSPWRSLAAVELATLAVGLLLKAAASLSGLLRCCSHEVEWFNHRQWLEPIGNLPPAAAEVAFPDKPEATKVAA